MEKKNIGKAEEEAAKAPNDPNAQGRKKHAGDAIFEDVNNDGQLDSKDMIFMGYVRPDKHRGSEELLIH